MALGATFARPMRCRRLIRCQGCGLSDSLCLCSSLPQLAPRTRVIVLAHRIELTKSTNTGRLVARMLPERARLEQSHCWEPAADVLPHAHSFVLFPSDDAQPLEAVAAEVQTLIIPDGTWAQSRRMARRQAHCRDLPKVRLSDTPHSAYALRRSAVQSGLCTLEAAVHALRVLEPELGAERMLEAFARWVQRALLVRAGAHDMRQERIAALD